MFRQRHSHFIGSEGHVCGGSVQCTGDVEESIEDSAKSKREATAGFEPAMGVLQTPALPLGYVA
jgi:hypothetical protein